MSNLAVAEILDKVSRGRDVKLHPMVVVDDSPLTVNLDGDTNTAVPARSLTGDPLAVGATGFAFWAPPLPPLVFTAAGVLETDLTYQSGFDSSNGGQAHVTRIGSQVFLDGGANRTAGNYTTTAETVAIIPAGYRPARTQRYASYGTGGRLGRVEIETNGNINIAAPNLISSTDEVFGWLGLSHTFLSD